MHFRFKKNYSPDYGAVRCGIRLRRCSLPNTSPPVSRATAAVLMAELDQLLTENDRVLSSLWSSLVSVGARRPPVWLATRFLPPKYAASTRSP